MTEVTTESWGSRLGNSIKAVIFGVIIFILGFPVLFWNEGAYVKDHKANAYMANNTQADCPIDDISSKNDGKLVHVKGITVTDEVLTDPEFKMISRKAFALNRNVEMYQWDEDVDTKTKKNTGGSTTTTKDYSYDKTWSRSPIDSTDFNQSEFQKWLSSHGEPANSSNPPMPFENESFRANSAKLGAYDLSSSLLAKISGTESISLDSITNMPKLTGKKVTKNANEFYFGFNPGSPVIGDTKVSFSYIPPKKEITIVAEQDGNGFKSHLTDIKGRSIFDLYMGLLSLEEVVSKREADATLKVWLIRLGGFLMMVIGLGMVFKPLSVVADVLPILGNITGAAFGIVAFLLAAFFSLITIAIAWLFYRPLFGILLIVIAVGAVVLMKMMTGKKKET